MGRQSREHGIVFLDHFIVVASDEVKIKLE
jgi:hypothetical protein